MVKILRPEIRADGQFFSQFGKIPLKARPKPKFCLRFFITRCKLLSHLGQILIAFLFLQNCGSLLQRNERTIIEHAEEFVVYETEMPFDMRPKEEIQIEPNPSLKNILGLSLKSITTSGSIFGPGTIAVIPGHISEKLTEVLWRKIQEKTPGKLLQIVIRQDDKLAPQTRIFRTIFYFYPDKNGLNFVFSEAAQNINFGNQYSFSDWANTHPLEQDSPLPIESSLSVNDKSGLSFRFENSRSEPCNPSDSNGEKKLFCRKIVFLPSAPASGKEAESDVEKSLIELKNLFEKKLINKTEYESKKKEILKRL